MAATKIPKLKTVPFALAHRGVYRSNAWGEQLDGFTPYAINTLPYDSLGRLRPGQRGGLSKYFSFQFQNAFIQHLSYASVTDVSAGTNKLYVIVGCGGKVYGQVPGGAINRLDSGGATFAVGRKISAITLNNVTYFTDGLTVKQYDWTAGTFGDWVGTTGGGTFPIANAEYPRILAVWRGRAVLARLDKGDPSQVFMSRLGDPTDFNYGATAAPNIAVALNSSFKAGQIGEGVTAIMPADNDFCYIGCENSINVLRGDPMDGGTLVPVSTSVGVLSDTSWCQVRSTIYFIGTGGVYRLAPGTEPVCISHFAINSAYKDAPHQGRYLSCAYDKKLHGIWFFSTKVSDTSVQTHHFYDLRTEEKFGIGGWWPVGFPADYSPSKALCFDGNAQTTDDRVILLGSATDGYVRTILDTNTGSDDGTAITSSAMLGVLNLAGPSGRFMVNGMFAVLGEQASADVACGWSLYAGPDPYTAFNSPTETRGGAFSTGGRQLPLGTRMSANSVWLLAGNETLGKTWSVENWAVNVQPCGPNR